MFNLISIFWYNYSNFFQTFLKPTIYIFEYFDQKYFFHVFAFNMSNVFKMTSIFVISLISCFNYAYF